MALGWLITWKWNGKIGIVYAESTQCIYNRPRGAFNSLPTVARNMTENWIYSTISTLDKRSTASHCIHTCELLCYLSPSHYTYMYNFSIRWFNKTHSPPRLVSPLPLQADPTNHHFPRSSAERRSENEMRSWSSPLAEPKYESVQIKCHIKWNLFPVFVNLNIATNSCYMP